MADRQLRVVIVGDNRSLSRTLNDSTKDLRKFSVGLGSIVKGAIVFSAFDAGFRAIGAGVRAAASEFTDMATVAAQTEAALKSTGGVANVTAKHVDELARSVSAYSGQDDEAVQAAENLLLTFKAVRNEVGKGNQIFDRATRAAVDLSQAGFGSLSTNAKQLGKVLNDPVKGMTALTRAGVTFTAEQRKQIKSLAESGKLLEAQKLVLREVESQVGGSARAFGQTLPGQLARMRESFRNTLGELAGKVAPALTGVLGSVNDFVQDLGKARTARAKFKVVTEGLENLGRDLFDQAKRAFDSVDWEAALATARKEALEAIRGIFELVGRIDFGAVGREVGKALSTALRQTASFIQSVDFQAVGKRIVSGIADFLKGVDWKAVAVGTIRLLIAAFKATASLLLGIGGELGGQIVAGIREGVSRLADTAFDALKKAGLNAALAIVEPFSHLPSILGSKFRQAKAAAEKELAEMAASARETASSIQTSLESIPNRTVTVAIDVTTGRREEGALGRQRGSVPNAAAAAKSAADSAAKSASNAAASAASATKSSAAAVEKASKEGQTAAEKQRAAFDKLIESIGLSIDQAAATKGFADDLRRNAELQAAIRAQIRVEGNTTDLARQLFEAQQARAEILAAQGEATRKAREQAAAALQATQFRALGLTGTGDKPIPTIANLKKQLAQLTNRLGPDVAPKIAGQLVRIGKVLSGQLGKVGEDVRAKIVEMFDGIRDTFDNETKKGPLTKESGLNTKQFLSGLELDPNTVREIRGRLSGLTSKGTGIAVSAAPSGNFVGATPILVESTTTLMLDGDVVARSVTRNQQKARRRNPAQKRGPNRSGL